MTNKTSVMDGALKHALEQRLSQLKAEYESGEKVMAELEAKQASLRETLLRISGAIQVLEESLAESLPALVEQALSRD